jgi:hypothetical protein
MTLVLPSIRPPFIVKYWPAFRIYPAEFNPPPIPLSNERIDFSHFHPHSQVATAPVDKRTNRVV